MALDAAFLDREFPSRRVSIQFNHAAVAPLSARAAEAMALYARRYAERGPLEDDASQREKRRLKELAARLVGADARVGGASAISVVPNTTTGISFVASGLPWVPGDEVVTTATEFPANLAPWLALERRGVVVRRVPTRDGAFTVEDVLSHLNERTRLLSVSAVAFHTGFVAPVAALGALCRARGIVFGLDAIQALGAVPVDVVASNVDFLSADGHKWLLGPEGCGFLFTTPELRARLATPPGWLNIVRGVKVFAPDETPTYQTDGAKFEIGAPPMPGVFALAASIELLLSIGLETIGARIAATRDVLVDGLPKLGYAPVLFESPLRSGILAARAPAGVDARRVAAALDARSITVAARAGFLRLSPHVGNEPAEAERVLDVLRRGV